jgi:hypothetical protein
MAFSTATVLALLFSVKITRYQRILKNYAFLFHNNRKNNCFSILFVSHKSAALHGCRRATRRDVARYIAINDGFQGRYFEIKTIGALIVPLEFVSSTNKQSSPELNLTDCVSPPSSRSRIGHRFIGFFDECFSGTHQVEAKRTFHRESSCLSAVPHRESSDFSLTRLLKICQLR